MNLRRPAVLSSLILFGAVLVILGLDHHGRASRVYATAGPVDGPRVERAWAGTPSEAVRKWRKAGFRGRKVLYAAASWNRVNPADLDPELPLHRPYPLDFFNYRQERENRIDDANFLFVASATGLAREVIALLPEQGLETVREQFSKAKILRPIPGGFFQTATGFPRRFITLGGLRETEEPVLLLVSASYFRSETPEGLLSAIRDAGLQADSVILCRSDQDGSVTDAERQGLERFAAMVGTSAKPMPGLAD